MGSRSSAAVVHSEPFTGGSLRHCKLFLLATFLAACEHPSAIAELEVSAVPGTYWGGGEAPLVSPQFFGGLGPVLIATSGNDTLHLRIGTADTFYVRLPDTTGLISVKLQHMGTGAVANVAIQTAGFAGFGTSFVADGRVTPYGSVATPGVLAISGAHLDFLALGSGTLTTLKPDWGPSFCGYGEATPIPSLADSTLVSENLPGCGPVVARSAVTGGAPSDTGLANGVLTVHIGAGRWLQLFKSTGARFAVRASPGAPLVTGPAFGSGYPHGIAASTHRDRLALAYYENFANGAVPVFDLAHDTVAFVLTDVDYTGGAAFTAGDTLLVLVKAHSTGGLAEVRVLNGLTGAEYRRVGLGTFGQDNLTLDPQGRFVYISTGSAVRVLSYPALDSIATLRLPHGQATPASDWSVLVPDPPDKRLYLVSAYNQPGAVVHVMIFATP